MEPGPGTTNGVVYTEKLTSDRTAALFLALMTLFLWLFIPVQDLSFSTRRPELVLQHLRDAMSANRAARAPLSAR